jgi:cysteine synthase
MKIFRGPDGLKNYLTPTGFNGDIVELPAKFNPFISERVHISAVVLYNTPVLNGKFFPAAKMISDARADGTLDGKKRAIEASSGNMDFALAVLAELNGLEKVIAVVPPNIASGKRKMLEVMGVEVIADPKSITKAKELGGQDGNINFFQYGNPSNPAGYEEYLAPEIWKLTEGNMSLFAAGLGTTGTMQGVAHFLKKQQAATKTLGVITSPGETVPGVRTDERLKEVEFDWKPDVDFTTYVGKDDSMVASLALSRAGLLAGPSSGFVLAGLHKLLAKIKEAGGLDELRNKKGEVDAVFVVFDTLLPYLDDYLPYKDGLSERWEKYLRSLRAI